MREIPSYKFIAGGRASTTKEAVDRLLDAVNRGSVEQEAPNQINMAESVFKVSVGKVEILGSPFS